MKKEIIQPPKNIARIEILNFIISSCTTKCFSDGGFHPPKRENSFHGDVFTPKKYPPIGSLCMLMSAPNTKWYLGWLKELKEDSCTKYLIESIEDNTVCWWENVSVFHLPIETSDQHPEWKWTDRQFKINYNWKKVCYEKREAYSLRPNQITFNEDGSLILSLRKAFSQDVFSEIKIESLEKATQKEMLSFYDASFLKHDKKDETISSE